MTDVGRAGRLRLERRLLIARHGAELLDRKERILLGELDRLQANAAGTQERWTQLASQAAVWMRRAAALDGWRGIEGASPRLPVEVEIQWGAMMGVRYPAAVRCAPAAARSPGGSSALAFAATAQRAALEAAVEHAAARRAALLVAHEVAATRSRRRAVENRWIPRLEGELLALRRQLDALELEEGLRLRWSAGHGTITRAPTDR